MTTNLGRWQLLVVLGLTQVACASGYAAFPSLDSRSPQQKRADQLNKCSASTEQTWDLGAGSLEDIADLAPEFYSFQPGEGEYRNKQRVSRLQEATLPEDVTLDYRIVSGQRFAELKSSAAESERIIIFSGRSGPSKLLLVPSQCPHLRVIENCVDGKAQTVVSAEGTVACFKGISGDLKLNGTGIPSDTLVKAGDPVNVAGSGAKFVTLDWRTQRLFSGPVAANQFRNATPEMLLAVLEHGDDSTAFLVFKELSPQALTPELRTHIEQSRLRRVTHILDTHDVLEVIESLAFAPEFPGSSQVHSLVDQKLASEFKLLVDAPPTGLGFWRGTLLIDRSSNVLSLPVQDFTDAYGEFLAKGQLEAEPEKVRGTEDEFLRRWPQSTWTAQIQERRRVETAERQAAMDQAMHQSSLNNLWDELEGVGDEIVSWVYRVQWLEKNGPKNGRTRLGISNMQTGIRLKKEQFCQLKQTFLKEGSSQDFRERADYHCEEDPPMENLGYGDVDLSKECRAQFRSGC